MTSSYLTFDLRYYLNIQCLGTGHAHVQISGLYYEVNRSYAFSIAGISNKRHPNVQDKTAQNICNLNIFQSLVNEKSKLCFSVNE